MTGKIVETCKKIFENKLVGVYLHGSMVMGGFNPDKSDIDVIIVINDDISDNQKHEFMKNIVELNKLAPAKGIEMSVVKRKYCKPFVYPTPYELHFSNSHLEWFRNEPEDYVKRMNGTDKDLAAHFTIINAYGKCLYGAAIDEVFGEVPREDYIDSIWYDVENAVEDVGDNPVYIVLNLCRVVAYLKDSRILSKKQGGEWGLKNLPCEYKELITEALECYVSATDEDMIPDISVAHDFCRYCIELIEKLK